MEDPPIETDVLVIGAGMAGCRAAIGAHDEGAKVILVTKGLLGRDDAATWMGTKGYQCWSIYPHDTLDVQAEDTLRAGWFLNNQENVYTFLALVPDGARELSEWGQRAVMRGTTYLPQWQLGCSIPEGRAISPATRKWGGIIGHDYARVIPQQVRKRAITVTEDTFITDLLTVKGTAVGAVGIDVRTGEFKVFKSKSTILATGGYMAIYPVITSNPRRTGDAQGIAFRAGADLMDFEFNQSLPCMLWPPAMEGDTLPFSLILEWGAYWYNSTGVRFMASWDPIMMERATRSVISRAIYHEVKAGRASPHGGIYCSVAHMPKKFIDEKIARQMRTPTFIKLREAGVDLHKDYIETGYVIHYCQGGLNINERCETSIPGLYAVGENAPGSKDGADRLMSNALPYCMATGRIGGREAAKRAKAIAMPEIDDSQVEKLRKRAFAPLERPEGPRVYAVEKPLRRLFMENLEYGRTEETLKTVIGEIERHKKEILPNLWVPNKSKKFNYEWIRILEFENMLLCAEALARNALMRTESRGLHDRWDYPKPSPDWFKNIHLRLVDGKLEQWTTPVEFTYWEPAKGSLGEPWNRGVKKKDWKGLTSEPLWKTMGVP